ncbi:MAG TPA: porin family protein [Flavobacterium sp.]|jgi:hypothetical protein
MKKIILLSVFLLGITSQAQLIKFGVKAGANFANLESEINTDNITSYHLGAVLEAKILPGFAIQPELMYSSQGATIEREDFKLDYISVPVLGKFYLIPGKVALEAGPQFSFLVNEDTPVFYKSKSFDFAILGGASVNITNDFFAQARYVIGLTDITKNSDAKNRVFQLSVGYRFL